MINRKIVHFTVWLTLALFVALSSVYAGDPDRIGTAGGTQLLVPVGARDLAMGGSNIADTRGVDAIYWNPAGLANMTSMASGVVSTMTIFNDININYLGVGFKAGGFGVIGVSIKSFDFGDIPETTVSDPDGASGRTFSPTFATVGLTYARMLTDRIQVGMTGNLIYESAPRIGATAFAMNIGLQYKDLGNLPGVDFGIAVKNIGTDIQYSGSALTTRATQPGVTEQQFFSRLSASHELPAQIELGLSYRRTLAEENNVTVSGVFENYNLGNDEYKFGAEYMFRELIALRAGYSMLNNTESEDRLYGFTAGLGLHYAFGNLDLTFDYAYRDSQYFDGNNLFSLKFGF